MVTSTGCSETRPVMIPTKPRPPAWKRYGMAIAIGLIATVLGRFHHTFGFSLIAVAYVALIASAMYGGRGPGLVVCGMIVAVAVVTTLRTGQLRQPNFFITISLFLVSAVALAVIMGSVREAQLLAEKLAGIAMRNSDRLAITLRSIGDAVLVTDPDGKIVSLNSVAERLTGWSEVDAIGRPLGEVLVLHHEETLEPVPDPIARVREVHHAVELPLRTILVARDGTTRAIDDSAAPIGTPGDDVEGYVLVFRDITNRRHAEKQLADAETRFRAFMDRSPAVAFVKDESGRYIWGNAAWRAEHADVEYFGIGMTDAQLWPDHIARQFQLSDRRLLDTRQTEEFIDLIQRENLPDTHWLTIKFPLDGPDDAPLIGGIALDVTEQIRQEQAIRESESRYRLLFAANPQPTWLIDNETTQFLAANEAAVRDYGYSQAEFLQMRLRDIQVPEELPALDDWLKRSRHERVAEHSWRHRRRDGTIIDVEFFSHVFQLADRTARVGIALDVTERLRAERALEVNRERLDLALNGARLGLWYSDLATGKLTLNDRARSHFGFTPDIEPTIGLYMAQVHADDRETIRESIERAISECGPFVGEHRVIVGNATRWTRVIGRAHADDGGKANRFDGISIDITEQKLDEIRLREAKESAVEASNAKSKLLAMLGHELRTPLTPVLASVSEFLDNPRRSAGDPESSRLEMRELLTMIRRNVELEARLISDLLDISRFERGEIRLECEIVDVHDVIRQGIEICQEAIVASGVRVFTELAAEQRFVDADHARLMQIVWNLVHNACKYTQSGGQLLVRTSNALTPNSESPLVVLEFIDNGAGIEPAFLERAFDPFEQESANRKHRQSGLGLGLAISRAIANAHGGNLSVTSEGKGRGATFRLELISTPERTRLPLSRPTINHRNAAASGRILLVEDNSDTLRYLLILLRSRGYSIETARRMSEAADHLERSSFDLMISDIDLPDGTGLELMRLIQGKTRGIALSGFGSEDDERLSLEAGFSAHITKPVDFARLESAIHQILESPTA